MKIDKVVRIAKRRGIIFPSSEIYGGISGFYDYGPIGVKIKRNLENFWREFFVRGEDNIFEIETSLLMPGKVWEASGHLEDFVDPLTQCERCNAMFRADDLIEEKTGEYVEGLSAEDLSRIIAEKKMKCPKCGGNLTGVKIFNLMFSTQVGPVEGNVAYWRPETAQGIFVNFKNILASTRAKLPFGVAQIGYSFRNEISPRRWIIRLREFRQMEIEYFFDPANPTHPNFDEVKDMKVRILTREAQEERKGEIEVVVRKAVENGIFPNQIFGYFLAKEFIFFQKLGIPGKFLRFRQLRKEETPHYSKVNFDLEIKFDFGWKEVVGNAYRTDYDLRTHSKHAGKDFSVVVDGKKIIPHVVEPSFGIDRTIYAMLLHNFVEDKKRGWDWFKLPTNLAPFAAGVFPLMKRNGLDEVAKKVYNELKKHFDVFYDELGSIGKRYARADEIGVPRCVTIDHQTLEDNTVTVRDRDTTKQIRVKIENLVEHLKESIISP